MEQLTYAIVARSDLPEIYCSKFEAFELKEILEHITQRVRRVHTLSGSEYSRMHRRHSKNLPVGGSSSYRRARLGQYAVQGELGYVNSLFHDAEPLLLGPKFTEASVQGFRGELPKGCTADFSIHSNGSLPNERPKDILLRSDVPISIGPDGDRIARDRPEGKEVHHEIVVPSGHE